MSTPNPYPNAAFPTVAPDLFFDTWAKVGGLYRDAMQANNQQLLQSSASIIQEHTLRAFIAASKACTEALAKNALAVQQQSLVRFTDANQKAVRVMGQAITQAWLGSLQPAK